MDKKPLSDEETAAIGDAIRQALETVAERVKVLYDDELKRLRSENAALKSAVESNATILKAQVEDSQENEKRLRADLEQAKSRECKDTCESWRLKCLYENAKAELEQAKTDRDDWKGKAFGAVIGKTGQVLGDAAKIQDLEAQLEQIRRERDGLLEELRECKDCPPAGDECARADRLMVERDQARREREEALSKLKGG